MAGRKGPKRFSEARVLDPKTKEKVVRLWEGHIDPIDGYPTLGVDGIAERLCLSITQVTKILSENSDEWSRQTASGYRRNNGAYVYGCMAWSKEERRYLGRMPKIDIPKAKVY